MRNSRRNFLGSLSAMLSSTLTRHVLAPLWRLEKVPTVSAASVTPRRIFIVICRCSEMGSGHSEHLGRGGNQEIHREAKGANLLFDYDSGWRIYRPMVFGRSTAGPEMLRPGTAKITDGTFSDVKKSRTRTDWVGTSLYR
jgi:hypothetical protein